MRPTLNVLDEALIVRILGEANRTAAAKLQTIKEQIQDEAGAARQALRNETEALAKEIAGKVLGRAV